MENVMKGKDNRLKLIDFGLSSVYNGQPLDKNKIVGTPNYIAPEIIKGEGAGKQADIWSLGVLLYILLTNEKPFKGKN